MRSIAAALLCFVALDVSAAPRPISDAERSAVQMVADYLSRGPAAIAERLDARSPLRRSSGQDLLDEIEARLGPAAGARWDLQTVVPALQNKAAVFGVSYPSGLDETVTFNLVAAGGDFKVADIQILALPSSRPALFPAAASSEETQHSLPANILPIGGGLMAALLMTAAAWTRRSFAAFARWSLVAGAAIAIAFLAIPTRSNAAKASPLKTGTGGHPRLAPLLPLRRAMAAGTTDASALSTAACHDPVCSGVAALWKAQAALQAMQSADVDRALAPFPSPSNVPLAEIVRGRTALLNANETDSALAYETAMDLGPGRDGLWFETAQALLTLGFNDRAERYLQRLARIGSREADVYYALAILRASKNRKDEAAADLAQAWKMRPVQRADLLEAAPLWPVLRTDTIAQQISLAPPDEATFAAADASSRAIRLPPSAVARMSGQFLHVQIGDSELLVSGGAALAPQGTSIVDAGAWARDEEERGLRDFQQLVTVARTPAALAAPALRRRFIRTADALAKRNRWADLISLTDGLSPKSESVPAELFLLRNQALHRSQRALEGQRLITELAASRVLQRRRDADSLERLAEMFAADDMYDLAIATYDRAQAIRPSAFIDERVRQIQMNKRLATKYSTYHTEHFEIRYPEDVHNVTAKQIGDILEAELKRLQKYVPVPQFSQVAVNIVWWDEFRSTYTGSDFILGFYNGKITVPLAGAVQFVPPVVALMTHELCHAMISQATNDQAPRWFQEGLAQRVEMRPFHANAFNMYEDNRLIAMSLLDPVIANSSDPDVISEGYIESQTVIRYIEAAYGDSGVKKFLDAYRGGATDEDAVRQVTGTSLTEFDTNLRAWGRSGARVFENPEPVHYEQPEDPDSINWSKKSK